jgi:hypothetical protein
LWWSMYRGIAPNLLFPTLRGEAVVSNVSFVELRVHPPTE